MNIQVFGRNKCSETKKTRRYFKERGIRLQFINLNGKEMSKGEFTHVEQAVGDLKNMIDQASRDRDLLTLIQYVAQEDREEEVFEDQRVPKTPIVRNASQTTVGYHPEMWKTQEQGIYLGIGHT